MKTLGWTLSLTSESSSINGSCELCPANGRALAHAGVTGSRHRRICKIAAKEYILADKDQRGKSLEQLEMDFEGLQILPDLCGSQHLCTRQVIATPLQASSRPRSACMACGCPTCAYGSLFNKTPAQHLKSAYLAGRSGERRFSSRSIVNPGAN